jgi:hypothetical protein
LRFQASITRRTISTFSCDIARSVSRDLRGRTVPPYRGRTKRGWLASTTRESCFRACAGIGRGHRRMGPREGKSPAPWRRAKSPWSVLSRTAVASTSRSRRRTRAGSPSPSSRGSPRQYAPNRVCCPRCSLTPACGSATPWACVGSTSTSAMIRTATCASRSTGASAGAGRSPATACARSRSRRTWRWRSIGRRAAEAGIRFQV